MNTYGLEPIEECEYQKMLELRETLELDSEKPEAERTIIPHTILTFAILRVKRYEKEIADLKAALELAQRGKI